MTTANAAFGEQRRAVPWWIPLIEGIVLVIVGILLFTNTAATIVVLAQVLAIYWLISGIMEIVSLFLDRTAWGLKLLGGIVGIWAGLYIISNPLIGTLTLGLGIVIILGIQALILGVIHLLVPVTLFGLVGSFIYLARGNVAAHRKAMQGLYFGACVTAGVFTLLPDCYLGHALWSALGVI